MYAMSAGFTVPAYRGIQNAVFGRSVSFLGKVSRAVSGQYVQNVRRQETKGILKPADVSRLQALTADTPEIQTLQVKADGNAVLHIPMPENDVILIEVDPGN